MRHNISIQAPVEKKKGKKGSKSGEVGKAESPSEEDCCILKPKHWHQLKGAFLKDEGFRRAIYQRFATDYLFGTSDGFPKSLMVAKSLAISAAEYVY